MSSSSSTSAPFDAKELIRAFRACRDSVANIPIVDFVAGCDQVKKIVYTIGSAFTIASSDIAEKMEVLSARSKEAAVSATANASSNSLSANAAASSGPSSSPTLSPSTSLQLLVLSEIERKVERENSSKFVSAARSLLRLMWLLDFLEALLVPLVEESSKLYECASHAYETALGVHHPWILRKTIEASMYFLPTKATFFANLAPDGDIAELTKNLKTFFELVAPVREELWRFYAEHKLKELP